MELQTLAGLSHSLQTAAAAALFIVVLAYFPKLNYKKQLAKLPLFGGSSTGEKQRQTFYSTANQLYNDGYAKFRDAVYRMATSDGEDRVVVPLSLLPELRKLPDNVLSLPKAIDDTMEAKYTKLQTESDIVIHSIKSDLTPALFRLNETIGNEVDTAFREYMPPCQDWTELHINQKLVNIVAMVSGRIFVGPEICHDPEYLDSGANYTVDLMDAVHAIKRVRPMLKPFLAPRLPEVRQLRERENRAAEYLEPIVKERMEAQKNDPNWQAPDDMMQWILNRSRGTRSVAQIAKWQLQLIFAAIHTTTMVTTNILYTLAVTPEYIQPLREEIRSAMAENGGKITSRALQQMEKVDSYMKEVMRIYPLGAISFGRRVLKGITLSNGQYLPPGVLIEVPSAAIYKDSSYYPDGDTFDGYRHYKLRRGGASTDHARNQFVTINETNLGFGYGRHACPGRFFAANEIKLILARLLLEYDIKMPGDATERHAQLEMGRSSMPNPGKTLLFKKVEI